MVYKINIHNEQMISGLMEIIGHPSRYSTRCMKVLQRLHKPCKSGLNLVQDDQRVVESSKVVQIFMKWFKGV
jgi:hypothetical protein